MFIIMVNYVKGLEEVDKNLKAHGEFLDKYYKQNKLIVSGRRNPRVGGVIISSVTSEAEIKEIMKEDPFYINGVAEYQFIEVMPTKSDERFNCFIK